MSLGLSILTFVHVVISLVGILSGLIVVFGLLTARMLDGWTIVFLSTTIATSVTGFFFPIQHVTPGIVLGVISLVVLAVSVWARYGRRLVGAWRWVYVVSAMIAFYLNVVVLIVQAFLKVPALNAMAPTQSEPPFLVTQIAFLALFILLTVAAVIRFRVEQPAHGRAPFQVA